MSDQGWNSPGTPPADQGGGWSQPAPPADGWSTPPAPPAPGAPPPPQQHAPPPPQPPQQQQQPQQQWSQQPPPQQQWGQPGPGGQPPSSPPHGSPDVPATAPQQQWGQQPGSAGGSSLEPNIGAMLAYLLFGWIGGLIMYLTQTDREVRFHGAQSIMLFLGLMAVQMVLWFVPFIGWLLGSLVALVSFGMWIFMSIQGYQLNHLKLPVIGDIAEQWAVK